MIGDLGWAARFWQPITAEQLRRMRNERELQRLSSQTRAAPAPRSRSMQTRHAQLARLRRVRAQS